MFCSVSTLSCVPTLDNLFFSFSYNLYAHCSQIYLCSFTSLLDLRPHNHVYITYLQLNVSRLKSSFTPFLPLFPVAIQRLCMPWGSSLCEIFLARMLELIATSSSRGSSQPRDRIHVSCISCLAGGFFTTEPPGKPPVQRASQLILWGI